MKVLKKKPAPWTRVFDCTCKARLEVNEADCRVVDDRDGVAYVFKCPECGEENWVAKSVVQRAVGKVETWREVATPKKRT